jgi:hypothetical protein
MSLAPFPFSIQGLSLVEKLAPLQEAYWSLLNQTRDNVKLINNAIVLLARDYDDPDSFEFAPGAVNTVDRPEQVKMWTPRPRSRGRDAADAADHAGHAVARDGPADLRPDVRARDGDRGRDALADRAERRAKMKDQITYAYQRVGYQIMRLDQQYVRKPQHFVQLGLDSKPEVEEIAPQLFQGDFASSSRRRPNRTSGRSGAPRRSRCCNWPSRPPPCSPR